MGRTVADERGRFPAAPPPAVTLEGGGCDLPRCVNCLRESLAEMPTEGGEVFDAAEGDHLAREVTDGRAFEGKAHDGEARLVGGGLTEEAIF